MYALVSNDPANKIDPLGLEEESARFLRRSDEAKVTGRQRAALELGHAMRTDYEQVRAIEAQIRQMESDRTRFVADEWAQVTLALACKAHPDAGDTFESMGLASVELGVTYLRGGGDVGMTQGSGAEAARVAAATAQRIRDGVRTDYRIRLWDTGTGKLLHELRPFEQDVCEAVEGLAWTADGRYVLAAVKYDRFFTSRSICLWEVAGGRHRAHFSGCPARVTGLALPPGGKTLAAGCRDENVRFRDLAGAEQEVRQFEASPAQ